MKKLMILYFLLLLVNIENYAQNYIFKCDGIYQTCDNGIKVINKYSASDIRKRDSIIALVNKDGVPREIKDMPDYYIIDKTPIVCFADFKSAKIKLQNGNKSILSIILNDNVKEKFAVATNRNIGKPMPIIFENKLISAPIVTFTIENGEMDISGLDDELIEKIIKKVDR